MWISCKGSGSTLDNRYQRLRVKVVAPAFFYYGKEAKSDGRVLFVRFENLLDRKKWLGGEDPERGLFRVAVLSHNPELRALIESGADWQRSYESGKYAAIQVAETGNA